MAQGLYSPKGTALATVPAVGQPNNAKESLNSLDESFEACFGGRLRRLQFDSTPMCGSPPEPSYLRQLLEEQEDGRPRAEIVYSDPEDAFNAARPRNNAWVGQVPSYTPEAFWDLADEDFREVEQLYTAVDAVDVQQLLVHIANPDSLLNFLLRPRPGRRLLSRIGTDVLDAERAVIMREPWYDRARRNQTLDANDEKLRNRLILGNIRIRYQLSQGWPQPVLDAFNEGLRRASALDETMQRILEF